MPHNRAGTGHAGDPPRALVAARRRDEVDRWRTRMAALGRRPKVVLYTRGEQSLAVLRQHAEDHGLAVAAMIVDTSTHEDPSLRRGWLDTVQLVESGRAHGVLMASAGDLSPSHGLYAGWVNSALAGSWFIELVLRSTSRVAAGG